MIKPSKYKRKSNRKYKKKTGRPKVKIDWEFVDSYLKAQCPGTEIAATIGICSDTLYRACEREKKMTFDAYSQEKKSIGQSILRATQFNTAIGFTNKDGVLYPNTTMQIWLGKQILGQKDKQDVNLKGSELIVHEVELPKFNEENER